jgi:hypothetical protein
LVGFDTDDAAVAAWRCWSYARARFVDLNLALKFGADAAQRII